MNKLVPLLDASRNSRTRALLRAGRAEAPPSGFSERLLLGLGATAAVSSVASGAAASGAGAAIKGAASTGSGAASLALVTAKWVVVGVLGGGILAGGTELAFSTGMRTTSANAASSSSGAPRGAVKAPAKQLVAAVPSVAVATPQDSPTVAPAAPAAPRTSSYAQAGLSATAAPASSAPSAQQGQLGREVQAIDFARHALASGDYARALAELDAFERMPQTGVLEREAKVLRIETLYKLGQVSRAQALSDQYLQAFPNDAHAARVRALGQAAQAR
jgi:Tetratricopeptide repeat